MRGARPWRQWTLRLRLAVAATGLAALALVVANTAGVVLLDRYLTARVDDNLRAPGAGTSGKQSRGQDDPGGQLGIAELAEALGGRGGGLLAERFGGDTRLFLYDEQGEATPVPATAEGAGPVLPDAAGLRQRAGEPFTVAGTSGADWRVYVRELPESHDGGGLVVTAVSLAQVEATLDRLLLIDAVVMAVVLALLGAVAALLVRVGLRPLTRMETTAGAIADGDFALRVADTDAHTEPGRLGRAMNAMLHRVESEISAREASEQRLRRFLADASHELRTPLTSIRGFAELHRRGGTAAGDALRRIEAEAARMGVLVDDLLLLARLDEQRVPEQRPVELLELAADAVRDLHARSPRRTVRLTALAEEGALIEPVAVYGDPLRLRQVLANLIVNADRHTPPDARITVRLGSAPASGRELPVAASVGELPVPGTRSAVLEVSDTGPGVPPEHAPYIFERLYRADAARGSGTGHGLGLSIAAALVDAHGGRIELAAPDGPGATFRVLLPLAATGTPSVL